MSRGRFVVLEGGEGAGKSTQARRLAQRRDALVTREPGGTRLGEALRSLLLDGEVPVDDRAEALLMAADRAQHVAEVVEPTLAAGRDVVSDRHTGSSLAYQGRGRGLGVEVIAEISAFATAGLRPDLVIVLDVAPGTRQQRSATAPDRLEAEAGSFHERVRRAYLDFAAAEATWEVVDASAPVDEVAASIDDIVARRFGW